MKVLDMSVLALGVLSISLLGACKPSTATGGVAVSVTSSPGETGPTVGNDSSAAGEETRDPMDYVISDRVRDAILLDASLAPASGAMTVDTLAGTVTLRGFVGTQPLKDRATTVVKAVGSVARVVNQLVVDPEAVRNAGPMESSVDRATSFRVRQALLEDRSVSSAVPSLRITTKNGVVRIEGTVDGEKVRQRIRTVVQAVGSVAQVDDQMKLAEK